VLSLLSACRRTEEALPPEIRPVKVLTIGNRADSGTVALTGTVQAQTEINQSFRIDGRLVERTADIGDTVKPGQLSARLDTQNEESGLQAAAFTCRIAFGPRAGQKVLTVQNAMTRCADIGQVLCADIIGFSLHAVVL
jgi:multidrug efflux pump subunit AcrA (membrane-fusion protein)